MADPIQEIKSKLSIEDIVAPYVPLKKSGKYLKACCPFHQEKTPSFYVSPERQLAYCFSCHKGGDLFQFIQDIEGLDFRGALELLADKAHVELPKFSTAPKVSKDQKERLKEINEAAAAFYEKKLWDSGDGEKVVQYLLKRGLTEKTIRDFQIGFAPEGKDGLYRVLLEKGFEKSDILESTLALARETGSQDVVDRFHLRLMIPIFNGQGEAVAFGGRALKTGDQPKYLNSADYVLYNKSQIVFNLQRAKNAIREKDFVVIVEGYFDVMASHQAGVPNVVATCGTALTEEQMKLLKRYTKKIAFAFDADAAGQAALLRAVQVAQPLGLELFVIQIPEGKDAADSVKENPETWLSAVENRKPYLDFYLSHIKENFNLAIATGKREATDFFLEILKGSTHPVELDHYLKALSGLVGTPHAMLYDYVNQLKKERYPRSVKKEKKEAPLPRGQRLVRALLGLLLAYPNVFFKHFEKLADFNTFEAHVKALGVVRPLNKLEAQRYSHFREHFAEALGDESSVYKQICDHYNAQGTVDESFYSGLEQGSELRKWAFEAEVSNTDPSTLETEIEKLIVELYFESLLHGSN